MSALVGEPRLRRTDYALLALVCLLLFGVALVAGRPLTGHEAVLPQNAREMMADHDWIIPKCGGLPWLERPPLPDWIIVGIAEVLGRCDRDWIVRIGPVLMGTCVVLMVSWLAAGWYGRTVGLLSGLILATMYEFFCFSSDPEGDIFLCAIVTGAIALFAHLEFFRKTDATERNGFFGRRPWPVLAFFVVFGMTNLAKGLIFGTLMVAVPVAGFLLWNFDFTRMRRYLWLWGWLAFAVAALAWPVAAYRRYPDIVPLWFSDYLTRLNQGYIGEPWWYYLTALPYVTMPWTVVSLLGLGLTAGKAMRQRYSPERFLLGWAVLTPAFFSIPDGKHHHYLLQCLAPWAVLGSLGAMQVWRSIPHWPGLLRNPLLGLVTLGVPGDVALVLLGPRIPGPAWFLPALLVTWPAFVFGLCWAVAQRNGRVAVGGVFGLLVAFYGAAYTYQTHWWDVYRDDNAFLRQARALVGADQPYFINFDADRPLETFQLLFYNDARVVMLHNLSFLRDERIQAPVVYLLARAKDAARLAKYGQAEVVLQSEHTKGETSPGERRALFRLRFDEHLQRKPADVYVSPLQATSRKEGPFLD
jgi:4-amino-4-deoxy-L-arabinose transferase-like glycosyltransferase